MNCTNMDMNPIKTPINQILLLCNRFIRKNPIHGRFFVIHGDYYWNFHKKTLNLQPKRRMSKSDNFIKNWIGISVATCVFSYLLWGFIDYDMFLKEGINGEVLCFDIMYCSIYALFSLWISNWLGNIFVRNKINRFRFVGHILLLLIANFAWAVIFENVFDSFWQAGNDVYWDRIYVFGVIATLLTMVNACQYYCSILIKKEKENVVLTNNLLRQQTNPHFIFNCINTLADLIEENPVQAESFTLKFSEIYRYVATHLGDDIVPIHEEIHFVKNYCELQKISSPHTIHVEIAEELKRCKDKTLSLAVQMMVENAIKHNCHTKECPLSISMYRQDEYIIVRNVLTPIKSSLPTTKKGLANLRLRYKQLGKELIVCKDDKYFEVKLPILSKS